MTEIPAAGERRHVLELPRWFVVVLGYSLLAAVPRALTLPAYLAMLVPGVAVVVLGVRRPLPRHPADDPSPGPTDLALWVTAAVTFAVWELAAFLLGNDDAHPTFSMLSDPVLATYPGRLLAWVAWLSVGRWLVTR